MIVAIDGLGRGRQEHGRTASGRAARLPLSRHRARCTGRSPGSRAQRGIALGERASSCGELAARATRSASTSAAASRSPRPTSPPSIRGPRSTASCRWSRGIPAVREVMRERASGSSRTRADVVIEGRDIGTVGRAARRQVKVYPRRRPLGARRPPPAPSGRDRRRRARAPTCELRRERRRAHAACGGRRADRHDRTSTSRTWSRGSRSSSAHASPRSRC